MVIVTRGEDIYGRGACAGAMGSACSVGEVAHYEVRGSEVVRPDGAEHRATELLEGVGWVVQCEDHRAARRNARPGREEAEDAQPRRWRHHVPIREAAGAVSHAAGMTNRAVSPTRLGDFYSHSLMNYRPMPRRSARRP